MGIGRRLATGLIVAGLLSGAGTLAIAADEDASKAIKARQDLMKSIGGNVKGLKEMLDGKTAETPAQAKERAEAISEAATKIAILFEPEYHISNVTDIETTAKPEVWTDSEEFAKKADALQEASTKLAMAADTEDMDAIKAAFGDMTKTCGGCHQTYRVKKN